MDRNTAPLPSSFDENADFYNENGLQKIGRRLREEPLVPFGCALTVWAIVGATRSMRKGDHKATNLYFRRRLYAQAFTIAVIVAGNVYWQQDRTKRKEYMKLKKEQEAMAKRERWLKELEARDEEEKDFKIRLAKRMRGVEEQVEDGAQGVTEMVKQKTIEAKEKAKGATEEATEKAKELKENIVGK